MKREHHIEKDLKGQYLWINREDVRGEIYEENIMRKQKISRLLPFYEVENMGEVHLVYSLEYRKNFVNALKNERMQCQQMESLIKSIVQLMQMMDEYLLDPSNLAMEMEYIYENSENWDFIYIPGYQEDFWKQMEKLSETWLNCVDYSDEKAVLWAYTFYEKVHGNMCSVEMFDDILKIEKPVLTIEEKPEFTEQHIPEKRKQNSKKERKTLWSRVTKNIKFKKGKNHKTEKENSEFFMKANTLEDTCPILNLTETYEETFKKTLTWIPMGNTNEGVIRFETIPVLVGRAQDEVDVCIEDLRISRIHMRIDHKNGQIIIVDMNSSNGSYRNGEKLIAGEAYTLHAGDIIKLADLEFICQWCA